MPRVAISFVLAIMTLVATSAQAQWLSYPTPGIPRTADGKPDVNAPAPRTANGKPDLTGIWQVNSGLAYVGNIVADLAADEIMPWAEKLYRQRMSDLGKDDSSTVGCLPRGPRYITGGAVPQLVEIVQTPVVIIMMYEELAYRRIYMDGRTLPKDPNPSFMGYSVGRWEGDVLVVESTGFNARTWLDFGGHPHTEALRITERYRRATAGRMDLQVTFEDPGAYRRAWTVPVTVTLAPDTGLLEYVCNENETRRTTLTGRTSEQQSISLSPSTLAEYAGTDVLPPTVRLPFKSVQIRNVGSDLFLDMDGRGKLLMVPLSATSFSIRLLSLEFGRDATGAVSQAVILENGAVLTKQR